MPTGVDNANDNENGADEKENGMADKDTDNVRKQIAEDVDATDEKEMDGDGE